MVSSPVLEWREDALLRLSGAGKTPGPQMVTVELSVKGFRNSNSGHSIYAKPVPGLLSHHVPGTPRGSKHMRARVRMHTHTHLSVILLPASSACPLSPNIQLAHSHCAANMCGDE